MTTADQIIEVFEGFRMAPLPTDQFEAKGREVLRSKIEPFLAGNNPIDFVMLGYPMKSPNHRDKTLGAIPDGAEEASFANISEFGRLVKQIHAPGINLSVVSDGYIFNDIMEVTDRTVEEYAERTQAMASGTPISWFDIRDFYDRHADLKTLREKVVLQHGITPEELERRILFDPDVNELYRGMIRFMNMDLAIRNYPSNSQLQKAAKQMAREMMFRNEAYSHLVQGEFKNHIRLSIHPSINAGQKYSFQLIPGDARHSPWHACLAILNGEYRTIHKKDAEAAGMELVYENNAPWYFTN